MPQFINISDDYGESQAVDLTFYQKAKPDGIFVEEKDGIYEFQIKGWIQQYLDNGKMSIEDLKIYSDYHGSWYQIAVLTETIPIPAPSPLYNVEFFRPEEYLVIATLTAVNYQEMMVYIGDVKNKGYTFYALENLSEFVHSMNIGPLAARIIGLLEIGAMAVRVRAERIQ